ncbi:uncharacterized protein BDZ99DRAFT_568429 [Mytilinidion resinicola]|uniref:Arrestin-like N-terminal domain-containing protein n=1 Tax=Mytilinidion resinicola TaxID=574789 RepID=A0A6A6YZ03_9PEZI|nr:uncharacterized protein BDZ99DRAFT_568429 [Mytilinidion resinicola]KAF2813187.1 hypothetical protein BDZ99DRAFT_568429 [Mytilinidion resinicola]
MVHPRELDIVVYGDRHRVYRPGNKVEGVVSFFPTTQQHIKSLTLDFSGRCVTKTTRPQYARPSDGRPPILEGLKRFEAEATLFRFERSLLVDCTVTAKRHSWPFEFTFPSHTRDRYPKWADSSKFPKDVHQLPPSYHIYMDEPGKEASITYGVTANVSYGRWQYKSDKAALHDLKFFNDSNVRPHLIAPTPMPHVLKEQRWTSTALRPAKHTLKQKLEHVVTHNPNLRTPSISIVPTVYCPPSISPQQDIPLKVSIQHIRRRPAVDPERIDCIFKSLTVSITTYNRTVCEGGIQDVTEQRRNCVTRRDINTSIPLDDSPFSLVSNLRLDDNAQCIASFATFTASRSYTLDIEMEAKCGPKTFIINSSTPLEILPSPSLSRPAAVGQPRESFEQLPAYEPRPTLPSYSESTGSTATLGSLASSDDDSGSEEEGGFDDGVSTPLTPPMTPGLDESDRREWVRDGKRAAV